MKPDEIVGKREPEPAEAEQHTDIDIDALVQEVREKIRASTVMQCGTIQVLDMIQPIGLNDIYISVNILKTITGRKRREIADLLQGFSPENFERCGLSNITEERVPGLTAVANHSKLIVLGKPGGGKTTFMKYLAIHCSLDDLQADKFPIFIALKDFAEAENQPGLLVYIAQLLRACDIADTQTFELLKHGRAMILLDGLDEVREEDNCRVLKQIREFYDQFHINQFVITCRIAGQEYTFEQFTEVEVADFDAQQIASFANKWFAATDPVKGNKFIQKLKENEPIQELATNPLLLTLLCLVFEESADLNLSRSQLNKAGLELLLNRWDTNRNIERDKVYKKLSVQHKKNLLGQIALITFKRCDYFIKQKELEQHITDYIRNLPGANTQMEALQFDSAVVLKSIEVQHGLLVERARGIYSFSHLTFHEYFTAREIVGSSDPQALETALKQLVSRITEKRWREVFLLSVEMLRNADYLLQLMKQQIDALVAQDDHLQAFLTWANQKSRTVTVPYKPEAVRAFYLALARTLALVSSKLDLDEVNAAFGGNLQENFDHAFAVGGDTLEIAFTLDPTFTINRTVAVELTAERTLIFALARALDLARVRTVDLGLAHTLALTLDFACTLAPELEHQVTPCALGESLLILLDRLPDPNKDKERFEEWWQANGGAWTEQLRAVMISKRNIGHDWQFSDQQREALRQYYNANWLLLDCLNTNCYVTRAVREELKETLLLPVAEIRERKL